MKRFGEFKGYRTEIVFDSLSKCFVARRVDIGFAKTPSPASEAKRRDSQHVPLPKIHAQALASPETPKAEPATNIPVAVD